MAREDFASDVGARKLVTIVFADVVGSTTAQESMDPEAVRAANDQLYALMREVVERHGGTVVKFVGDAVMAAFGVPQTNEDDALRALAAAIELRDAFGTELRIGINSGEVVVADGDTDVVGDAVNVASRLEHAARPGTVLVGDDTYRLTRDAAGFGPAEPLVLKGRTAPVDARVLHDVREQAGAPATDFVGREHELAVLVDGLGTAQSAGRARLVTVIGSPGVGKSRLLAELAARVEGAAVVLQGRCEPTGTTSLEPIVPVVQNAVAAAGGVDAWSIDGAERDRLVRAMQALTTSGGVATAQEMFWATRRTIELVARHQPVLVVLDDLHWAEPVLLDLVEHLAEWIRDVPVLVVAAGRPELRELRPSIVEVGGVASSVLAIEGLDAEATRALAATLLGTGGLPADVVTRVLTATDGNPLFVRELVRMLVDDGVLRFEDDDWILTVDPADIEVPSSVNALLAARIDRLPADERIVLERASVLGREVVRGALADLVPAATREIFPAVLESLRRRELLEPAGEYWIDEPLLRFHHVLIQDACYRRVLKAARGDLHERAARWFADKTGNDTEHDELIGFHLEQSHANRMDIGAEGEETMLVAKEASERLGRAARRALDRDDLAAAAALSARALGCLPQHDPARAGLLLSECEARLETGNVAAARPALEELQALASGDARLAAWSSAFLAQLGVLTGTAPLADVEAQARDAADELEAIDDPAGAAKAHRVRATALARLGQIGEAELELDRALTAARRADDHRQITGVLAAAPLAALWGPSPVPRAGGRCLDVVRLLRITTRAREVEAISLRCQAVLETFRGRNDAARTMLRRVRDILEDLGVQHGLLDLELASGIIELIADRPDAAADHLEAARAGFRTMGLDADAAHAAALLGRAALRRGDDRSARAWADEAASAAGGDLATAVAWRTVKAEVLARAGEYDAALVVAREAADLAATTDALVDRADARAVLATVLELSGDGPGATAARRDAIDLYEQKGATALAARLGGDRNESRLAPSAPVSPGPTAVLRSVAALATAVQHRDWSTVEALYADDFEYVDHRVLVGRFELDKPRVLATLRAATEADADTAYETAPLETRGERLLLARYIGRTGDAEVAFLQVNEIDADGRIRRAIVFDTDDIETAVRELDRLATETHGRSLQEVASARMWPLMQAGRWDDAILFLNPEYVLEDRRRTLAERRMDLDRTVEATVAFDALGLAWTGIEFVVTRGERLMLSKQAFTGGDNVFETLAVSECDHAGRALLSIVFDLDDLDGAMAELDRLATEHGIVPYAAVPPNQAVLISRVGYALLGERRWDDVRRLLRDDFVLEDRRPGAAERVMDRHRVVAMASDVAHLGHRLLHGETMATRGDTLVLDRLAVGNDDFQDEFLALNQIDDEGHGRRAIHFAPDALDAALAELQRLAERSDAPSENLAARVFLHAYELGRAERWDEYRALLRPDFRYVSEATGLLAWPGLVLGPEEAVAAMRATALTTIWVMELVAVAGDTLALIRSEQATPEGFQAQGALYLNQVDPLGRSELTIQFDATDLDAATAALAERHRALVGHPAVAAARESLAAISRGDTHLATVMAGENFTYDDRRTMFGFDSEDPNALQQSWDLMSLSEFDIEPLAARGDRLALMRITVRFHDRDFSGTALVLNALDENGRGLANVVFDETDLEAAVAELDARAGDASE